MTDQYVPALRQHFLEDMRIKGPQPKTMYLQAMRDFTSVPGLLFNWDRVHAS